MRLCRNILFSLSAMLLLVSVNPVYSFQKAGSKKNDPRYVLVRKANNNPFVFGDPGAKYYPIGDIENGRIDASLGGIWQYGLLAHNTYNDDLGARFNGICPVATRYMDRWQRVPGYSEIESPASAEKGRVKIPGFGYRVWRDISNPATPKVAIVFRGTRLEKFGDHYANMRWITKVNVFTSDHYRQARNLVAELIPKLKKQFGKNTQIIAVGHSLGGGIAQHSGYSSSDISLVYAFASSPVTSKTRPDPRVNKENRKGLRIYRIYESGELLAKPRWLVRRMAPLSAENPEVTEVKFSFRSSILSGGNLQANSVSQHGIRQLSCDMICHIEYGLSNDECSVRVD